MKRNDPSVRRAARSMLLAVTFTVTAAAAAQMQRPLVVEKQGSFFVGGRQIEGPEIFDPTENVGVTNDQTFWIDQLYAEFQIPPAARDLPLVLVHGSGQTGKTWESTPDGRDGYQSIFPSSGLWRFYRRLSAARPGWHSFV